MNRAVLAVLLALVAISAPISGPMALAGAAEDADDGSGLSERWAKTVGGGDDDKLATALKVEGGYLVVGWSNSSAGDGKHDGYVAMLDRSGRTTWERTYGGPGSDRFFDVERVADGYLLAGMETEETGGTWDGWLVKVARDGEVEWKRTYGESGPEAFWSLERSGNSVYAAGWQKESSTRTAEAWVMKLRADGTPVWDENYDTLRSGADEYVNSVFVTDSGDLLLTGTIKGSTFDPADGWVLKVDGHDGDARWKRAYGGTDFDQVHDAVATSDGGFVLAGQTASQGDGERDGWMFKIRADGEVVWERTYGTKKHDAFFGIHDDPDGGFVVSGTKHVLGARGADGWVVKTDDAGRKRWERTYGENYWDKFWPVVEGHGGGYLAIGESTSYGDNRDGWVVRLGGPSVAAIQDADENASGTTVRLESSPVRAVTLAESNVSGVLAVTEETNLSALSPPGDPAYVVSMTGPEAVENGSATVEFAVRTDALDAPVADLRVARQTTEGWTVLETTVVSADNGTVVLSATTNASGTLAVTAVDAPTASIDVKDVVAVGESVTLSAASSSAENGTLSAYEWRVRDETYDGETASISFDSPGEYTVNLTVADEHGVRDTATATLVVNDEPEVGVRAPESVAVGKAGRFSADVTDEVGSVTVTWQFGEVEVAGESVEHSFGSPGTKTVTVVVEDEYGATVTKEVQVRVRAQDDDQNGEQTGDRTTERDEGTPTETTTTTAAGDGGVPGFGVGAALVALLVAALVATRVRT